MVELHRLKYDKRVKSLIQMGTQGFYPLFYNEWIQQSFDSSKKLTLKDQRKVKGLVKRLFKHKSPERQKTVLFSMTDEDKRILIKTFFELVEGEILDQDPKIH